MSEVHGSAVDADGAGIAVASEHQEDIALSSIGQKFLEIVEEIATHPERRIFAVMDGAQFDDLPARLKQAGVSHRPLYRYAGGDYAIILGGPWFIDPYLSLLGTPQSKAEVDDDDVSGEELSAEELEARSAALSAQMVDALNAGDPTAGGVLPDAGGLGNSLAIRNLHEVLKIGDGKPGMVFWIGDKDLAGDVLYRHLRGINRVRIPKRHDDLDGNNVQELGAAGDDEALARDAGDRCELAIFRHADANALIQVLPTLDEHQIARLLGPADQIMFAPDEFWGGGIKRGRKANGSPDAPKGPLTLSDDNLRIVSQMRDVKSHQRISGYLDCTAHKQLDHLDAESRDRWIAKHITEARSFGVRAEADLGRWCYLQAITNGRLTAQPGVIEYMRSAGLTDADEKVRLLFRSIQAAAQTGGAAS
ncbi:hypothetical protein EV128_101580 [Rhizobium azibense]|nr:hypothetical protein EV128_101580 [Rhizobium azibense]